MTLPNFLVIGAQRSGTSWLDQNLRNHVEIYLPKKRKEIHYFDRYYERGLKWYESFFPSESESRNYKWVGEITPRYIFEPEVSERIYQTIPDCKFIVILRNPADRAYSNYGLKVRNKAYRKSFLEYLAEHPEAFEKGLYAEQLERYLQYFQLDQFLFLIFEETNKKPQQAFERIFKFLSLDSTKYSENFQKEKVNSSYIVKHAKSYTLIRNFVTWLRKNDLDWVFNTAKRLRVSKFIFGNAGQLPKIDSQIKQKLLADYEKDIQSLERLIQIDLSFWRQ